MSHDAGTPTSPGTTTRVERLAASPRRRPRALAPGNLILTVVLSLFGAVVGMQLLATLGITPSTSLVGALAAMTLARIPLAAFRGYRSVHAQNLAQTSSSRTGCSSTTGRCRPSTRPTSPRSRPVPPWRPRDLAVWAIPGALVQFLGGPRRQLGILLATGLLITTPMAGWMVAAGLVCRLLAPRVLGPRVQEDLEVFAGGAIAGDALYSFGHGAFDALCK
ncbi:hypothetical protein [Streptomyces sp. NPDC048445]|uniref:hypothetical protein n=1 Tax=Streptomyces sp. NPDC048445 TaxID=3365553 RepID=UPI003719B4F7